MDRCGCAALLLGALGFGLFAAPAARSETDLGPGILTGELEAGGKFLTGDWGSSQFREYQDQRPGFFGQANLLFQGKETPDYFGLDYQYTGTDDQSYGGRFGRWGVWGVELEYMQYPFDYSETAQSPYLRAGNQYLLPVPLQAQIQATAANAGKAAILGTALMASRGVDLESMYRTGRAEARYQVTGSMAARVGYSVQHRNGARPLGIAFGTPGGNFADFAGQVDDWIHNANAGVDLMGDAWNLAFDYDGSFYLNDVDDLIVANPLRATNATVAAQGGFAPERGRISRAPDNQSNTFSLTGGWKLPIEIPTRLTGTFSYGQRTQDDDFLQHTINPVIQAANAAVLVLPEQRLGGEVDTYLANLVLTSQLTEALDAKVRYRYYDYDNNTPTIDFPALVENDFAVQGEEQSVASSYRRQTVATDLTYQLAKPLSMSFGYEWDDWKRSSDRERIYQDTHTGKISANLRPDPRVQVRATYALSARRGSDYRTYAPAFAKLPADEVEAEIPFLQIPGLRKFDEANYWRNEANLLAQFMLTEGLDATIAAGYGNNDYDESPYGLQAWQDWNVGADLAYRPFAWLGLSGGYEYQDIRANQKQRYVPVPTATGIPVNTPLNDWWSRWHMAAHNAHAAVDVTVVPNLVDVHVAYGLELSRDRTRTNGTAGGPFLVNLDWPTDGDTLQFLTTRIDFHVTEMLTLRAAWRWERFDLHNFRRSSSFGPYNPFSNNNTTTGAVSPSTDVFLGDRVEDYDVHIVGLSAVLNF